MTRIAIGIGCRKGCAAEAITALVERALAEIPTSAGNIPPLLAGEGGPSKAEGRVGSAPCNHPQPSRTCGPSHPPPLRGGGMGAALFTAAAKRNEPGIAQTAATLGLPLVVLDDAALAAAASRCVTRSARIEALTGLPSLAEAAALAGAGPGSRLVVPRITDGGATCAIAMSENAP